MFFIGAVPLLGCLALTGPPFPATVKPMNVVEARVDARLGPGTVAKLKLPRLLGGVPTEVRVELPAITPERAKDLRISKSCACFEARLAIEEISGEKRVFIRLSGVPKSPVFGGAVFFYPHVDGFEELSKVDRAKLSKGSIDFKAVVDDPVTLELSSARMPSHGGVIHIDLKAAVGVVVDPDSIRMSPDPLALVSTAVRPDGVVRLALERKSLGSEGNKLAADSFQFPLACSFRYRNNETLLPYRGVVQLWVGHLVRVLPPTLLVDSSIGDETIEFSILDVRDLRSSDGEFPYGIWVQRAGADPVRLVSSQFTSRVVTPRRWQVSVSMAEIKLGDAEARLLLSPKQSEDSSDVVAQAVLLSR